MNVDVPIVCLMHNKSLEYCNPNDVKGMQKKKACQPPQNTVQLIVNKQLIVGGNKRVLAMPKVNHIKNLRNNKSLSIIEISNLTFFS